MFPNDKIHILTLILPVLARLFRLILEYAGKEKNSGSFCVRELPKKNAALIWISSKTGLTPPHFWIFWDTFLKVKTF